MTKNEKSEEINLAANAAGSAQVNPANVERFNRGLDELNRKMRPRPARPIQWDVTELLGPFLPNCVTVGDFVRAYKSLGFNPRQDKVGKRYYIYIRVEYDRLSAQGRTHFLPGDWLVINYEAGGPGEEAPLTEFKATLLNDSVL
ncbi:MAG TPA: hypothetical protein VFW73_05520 [Lacipirellulaceae bacterium]|nr:hypothetical protein [Lacipirellulaceae bacterium]